MATLKLKFRPSTVDGREGTLHLQVTHGRTSRQIATGLKLYPAEWDGKRPVIPRQDEQPDRHAHLTSLQSKLDESIARLMGIMRRLESSGRPFTARQVVESYISTSSVGSRLTTFARATADHLRRIGKDRLSETYTTAVNSFMRYRGGRGDVAFDEMDAEMMADYEAYLRRRGLVANTTSFYMRNLRAIYNRAVERGLTADRAPFRHVYTGIGKTAKRAVPPKVISSIKALDLPPHSSLEQARDLFMFSFYTRGMSFIDMAYLKKKDLHDGILAYRRQKTDQQLFIKWEKPMQDIIDRHPNPGSPYLLPIITMTGDGRRRQYLNAIRQMNTRLKVIGRRVNSPVALTSYVARHGWATIAKSHGVPLPVISEAMGHGSEATTRIYLASLDTTPVDEANNVVINSI